MKHAMMKRLCAGLLCLLCSYAHAALVRTDYTPSVSTTNFGVGSFTSASFTPPDNSLLVIRVMGIAIAPAAAAASANYVLTNSAGLTFTARVNRDGTGATDTYGQGIWTAPITTGVSMTVTIDTVADAAMYGYAIEPFAFVGYDTTTPTGATATGTDADGDGAASITLSGSPATSSVVLGSTASEVDTGFVAPTPGSGFTEIHDGIGWTDWFTGQSEFRTSSSSTTVDWTDLSTAGIPIETSLMALEIRAAAGGSSTILPITRRRH